MCESASIKICTVQDPTNVTVQAELRAAVFRVMHDSAMPSTAEKPGPKLNAFPAEVTDVVMELVSECFAFFQWNHSLLVLRAEANVETTIELPVDGKKLAQKLGLLGEVNMPALLCLVQERLAPREEKQIPAVTAAQLSQNEDFGVTAAALRFKSASLARQDEDKGKDSADEDRSIEAGEISEEEDVSQQEEEEDGELETTAPIDSNFTTPSTRRNQNDADTVEKTNDVVATSNFERHESDEYENDHFERTRAALVSKTSINDQDGDNGEEEHAAMKPDTNAIAMKDVDDEDDEEVELEESVAEDSMADDYASASDFESSIDPANAAPSTLPPPQLQDDNDDDENDTHPPPVPMHMMPLYHPFPSIASPTLANDHEDDNAGARDDGFDPVSFAASYDVGRFELIPCVTVNRKKRQLESARWMRSSRQWRPRTTRVLCSSSRHRCSSSSSATRTAMRMTETVKGMAAATLK